MIRSPRLLLVFAGAALLCGCSAAASGSAAAPAQVREADVRAALSALAHDSMAGRGTGTEGAARAARFIARELRRHGARPAYAGSGDSAYFQPVPITRRAGPDGRVRLGLAASMAEWAALPAEQRLLDVNVIGVIQGSDPALRDEAVLVGAHFDHEGIGTPVGGDSIFNGADDDASGVVAVLEIARALAAPRRTVLLLLTTGEESGMLGTRWYADNPLVPLARTAADLQIEMIGRPDSLAGGPGRAWLTGYARSTMGEALAAAGSPLVPDPRPQMQFFLRSDNVVYACRGIPAHTLSSFNLHGDYHTPDDEVDRVDFGHMTRVIQATIEAVRMLADGPRPAWTPDGNPSAEAGCAPF